MFRGEHVFEQADKANEEAKLRSKNSASQFRFYLPPGGESQIIILDKKLVAGMHEHDVDIPGKKVKKYVPCIAALPGQKCPLCNAGERKTFRMFLTVLDLAEYTDSRGRKVTRRKRLLPINQGDKERWQSIQQDAIKLHGTLRGTYIYMKRPNEQRSSRIGEPFAIEGRIWQHIPEAELVKDYGHKAVMEGAKVLRPANDDITAYNYDEIFPYPDDEYIAYLNSEYGNGVPKNSEHGDDEPGGAASVGSAADVDQAWEEEIAEGHPEDETAAGGELAEGEVIDHTGLGEAADGGDEAAAEALTSIAQSHGIDTEGYADWTSVEAAIEEAVNPPPPPTPAKKLAVKKAIVRPAPAPAAAPRPVVRPVVKPAPAPLAKKVAVPLKRPGAAAPSSIVRPPVRPNRGAFGG